MGVLGRNVKDFTFFLATRQIQSTVMHTTVNITTAIDDDVAISVIVFSAFVSHGNEGELGDAVIAVVATNVDCTTVLDSVSTSRKYQDFLLQMV